MRPRVAPSILIALCLATADEVAGAPGEVVFVPLTPCRLVDTRTDFTSTPGPLVPGEVKRYFFRDRCGIPGLTADGGSEVNQARALALNIVAVSPAGLGHLTAWPTNQAMPATSVINYSPGQNIANGVIVPMCDQEIPGADACPTGDISFVAAVSSTHLVVDVTGYYIKSVIPGGRGRYGAGASVDSFPCINAALGVRCGLSFEMAQFANAEALCPAGTWLCEHSQLPPAGCNTGRPDTACDRRSCDGTCIDDPADEHQGWVHPGDGFHLTPGQGFARSEQSTSLNPEACEALPAWCCSKN